MTHRAHQSMKTWKDLSKPLSALAATFAIIVTGCASNPAPPPASPPTTVNQPTRAERTSTEGVPDSPMPSIPAGADNSNVLLGNPSKAASDENKNQNNDLVERPQHAMSYHQANVGPNWVAWH